MSYKIFEYIWLDGYTTQNLRSKIKITYDDIDTSDITNIPVWNFDGSSTMQATGDDSECVLKPVRLYKKQNIFGANSHFYVLCEVFNPNGTPHESNKRFNLRTMQAEISDNEYWWGFEQEYFLTRENGMPVGFPNMGYPKPQGKYYCGVGSSQVQNRALVELHMYDCLRLGIKLTGINAEVAIGQWEFQCFSDDTLKACDDLWMSRYILHKIAETYSLNADLRPKPVGGDWNGSGCHTNFSNKIMREANNEGYYKEILFKFENLHDNHIRDYGENNKQRLTGHHETQHIDEFSWGIGDRGASIRIPMTTVENNWNGYLEDRRPASNCDPYKVAYRIMNTIATKDVQMRLF
jgi:glutamine synthetase